MKEYLTWFFTKRVKQGWSQMMKIPATIYGIVQAIYATPIVWNEWYYGHMPILPLIGAYIAIYGFLIGIIYQPISIYRELKRLGRL